MFILVHALLQIQFDSFSAPLKLLGCFAKNIKEFPLKYTNLELRSKTDMELEFPLLSPPVVELSKDSFIYCASEIFRYLRDMALNIPLSQSKPLLRPPKSVKCNSPTVAESSSPMLPHVDGGPKKFFSGFLIHPGAILCVIDLLPTIDYDLVMSQESNVIHYDERLVMNECTDCDLASNIKSNNEIKNDWNSSIGKKVCVLFKLCRYNFLLQCSHVETSSIYVHINCKLIQHVL